MKHLLICRRAHFPLMLIFSLCAPVLFLLCRPSQGSPVLLWSFPFVCVLISMLCMAVPGRMRLVCAVFGTGLYAGLLHLCLPAGCAHMVAAAALCAAALVLCALPLAVRSEHSISPAFFAVGLMLHVFVQILLHLFLRDGDDALRPAAAPLTVAFVLYLFLLLLSLNRITLDNAALSRHRLPASMRRINVLLVFFFFALSLLITLLPAVSRGIILGFRLLRSGAVRLLLWILRLFSDSASTGGHGMEHAEHIPAFGAMEYSISPFFVFFEKIVTILTAVAVAVGSVLLLRMLLRLLLKLYRVLSAQLRLYACAVSEDYVDEITDTREAHESSILFPLFRRTGDTNQPETPREQIRHRYARLLARHKNWSASSTARENLTPSSASIYERTRYSTHDISPEDARRFMQET